MPARRRCGAPLGAATRLGAATAARARGELTWSAALPRHRAASTSEALSDRFE